MALEAIIKELSLKVVLVYLECAPRFVRLIPRVVSGLAVLAVRLFQFRRVQQSAALPYALKSMAVMNF
ncbi:hypothetical protein BT63DRAFT_97833 [Microthyrium microscopicum]|uniref:Uncharacterized protein n=1 Tax=Microthyrium microscopicum TaxID=703497 RepID=A0A6A6TXG4_9PEZI|nr:hypothetical protein BT63DRAFT_97833 [Microthyrium microscopicum]